MKREITKWHKETFRDGDYVYYLDYSNSFTGICQNSSNSTYVQFTVYQLYLIRLLKKNDATFHSQRYYSLNVGKIPFLNLGADFIDFELGYWFHSCIQLVKIHLSYVYFSVYRLFFNRKTTAKSKIIKPEGIPERNM